MGNRLEEIYCLLYDVYGPQGWWPADTQFEVIVGAVLTQNVAWKNVERAIENLKNADALEPEKLIGLEKEKLALLIKPTGFYNAKSETLLRVTKAYLSERWEDLSTKELRKRLLKIKGVGKETADSIILYAFDRAIFVVDKYTVRFVTRLGITTHETYDEVQRIFHEQLKPDVELYKEYHALIVEHAKKYCKKQPDCAGCFIGDCKFRKESQI